MIRNAAALVGAGMLTVVLGAVPAGAFFVPRLPPANLLAAKPKPAPAPGAKRASDVPPPKARPDTHDDQPDVVDADAAGQPAGKAAGGSSTEAQQPLLPRPRPPQAHPAPPDADDGQAENAEAEQETAPRLYQAACPAVLDGRVVARIASPISVQGKVCRQQSPYRVTGLSVGGRLVKFTAPALLDCEMATALGEWVSRVDAYLTATMKSGVKALRTGTSYMCRARNNVPGGLTSEHGFANGIDIVGFTLEDETAVTLPDAWPGDTKAARAMRYAHDAGCGLFTTVLGPEANALHRTHLHLDLGCHGKSCTYRLCQ